MGKKKTGEALHVERKFIRGTVSSESGRELDDAEVGALGPEAIQELLDLGILSGSAPEPEAPAE